MQSKLNKTKIEAKLKKYSSHTKFQTIQNHSLNKSPTKNVPSFHTGSLRFLKPSSFSPNKFYDIPQTKSKKSVSFGYGTKTNFQKKQFIEPTRYKVFSTFDLKTLQRKPGPTFGISRSDFYKGKLTKTNDKLGPGKYDIKSNTDFRKSFYLGVKISRKDETISPGPAAYNLRSNQNIRIRKGSANLNIKAPRIRTQYFQKAPLEKYDNKVPGPGTYDLSLTQSQIKIQKNQQVKSRLPQCPRFKVHDDAIPPPGSQQKIEIKLVSHFQFLDLELFSLYFLCQIKYLLPKLKKK